MDVRDSEIAATIDSLRRWCLGVYLSVDSILEFTLHLRRLDRGTPKEQFSCFKLYATLSMT